MPYLFGLLSGGESCTLHYAIAKGYRIVSLFESFI
jgi:hypothetical protein